jgi:hypothetical protein
MRDIDIARRLEALRIEQARLETQTADRLKEIKTERAGLIETMQLRAVGLDEGKLRIAESVIYVQGKHEREGGCVDKAIAQIANGDEHLKTIAIAVKDYAQFSGQGCDCTYGYGPKHGHHVFEVGLTREARKRDLTDDERDAAIYYLVHLKQIQEARAKAVA